MPRRNIHRALYMVTTLASIAVTSTRNVKISPDGYLIRRTMLLP